MFIGVKKVCAIRQLEGITFFALFIKYRIVFDLFLFGKIISKYSIVICSILLTKSMNQSNCNIFYPLFPSIHGRWGWGNILYWLWIMSCGYLVTPMVAPKSDNEIIWLLGLYLNPYLNKKNASCFIIYFQNNDFFNILV